MATRPRIFISYSRVDKNFVEKFVDNISKLYEVWYDANLLGGENWWKEILNQIQNCDIFIYLLSNESVQSEYCQAEFEEAIRLQKPFIPVQIRDRTKIPPEINEIQHIDMKDGPQSVEKLTDLFVAIQSLYEKLPKRKPRPLTSTPTPCPTMDKEEKRKVGKADVDTPPLEIPKLSENSPRGSIITPLLVTAIAFVLLYILIGNTNPEPMPTVVTQAINANTSTATITNTSFPTYTSTQTATSTDTIEPSITPTGTVFAQLRQAYSSGNVREGPGLNYEAIAFVRQGEILIIYGSQEAVDGSGIWYNIKTPAGERGWVAGNILDLSILPTYIPTVLETFIPPTPILSTRTPVISRVTNTPHPQQSIAPTWTPRPGETSPPIPPPPDTPIPQTSCTSVSIGGAGNVSVGTTMYINADHNGQQTRTARYEVRFELTGPTSLNAVEELYPYNFPRDEGTQNVGWTPTQAGSYTMTVVVLDRDEGNRECARASRNFTVTQ